MVVNKVVLKNFRNFDLKQLNAKKINIIIGKNASGKTNLLEGIYTILNGHSFKKSNVVIQKHNTNRTQLIAVADNNKKIEIDIENGLKTIKIDNKKSNIIKLKELFPSIIYSIDSFLSFKNKDYLFSLIDRNSFIENKNIIDELIEYKKLIRVKKKILSSPEKPDEKLLYITNERILKIMDEITKKREKSVKYINDNINKTLKEFTKKTGFIVYQKEKRATDTTKNEICKRRILTSLNRDKIEIMLNDKNLFNYSSVGEKKMVLFCIIISIIKHYNKYIKPVLLIDDLEGDLDLDFKNTAFNILVDLPNQLFLTTLGEYLYNDANIIRL